MLRILLPLAFLCTACVTPTSDVERWKDGVEELRESSSEKPTPMPPAPATPPLPERDD